MKMKSVKCAVLLIAAVLLALAGPARAQYQGRLEGVVTDSEGAPLAKVAITVVSQKSSAMYYNLTTDAEGKFSQVGFTPGYFQISFKKEGFLPKSAEIHIKIADVTKLAVTMEKGSEILEKALSEADKLFLKGNKLLEEKKHDEAVATFQEAIALTATSWGYHFNLGLAYKKLGKAEEALAAFRKAVELNPDSYSANKELGEALAKKDAFKEAVPYYEKAVALSPEDPDAHFNLGACLMNEGRTEEALAGFLKAVEFKPDYADAYYQIGTIYIGQNNSVDAVAALEKFLALAPDHEKAPVAKQLIEYLKK
jgi:tetratricopeptide (TPR) repeat protein